ncbi:SusC/RagA family TonB-linked outer membrane protein [Aurantibacter sp.]|uniref:SusC/RagA family TonB-linked outer membrane protein n=1 Tax=Aurantibacter sp. TaxID=2807103 RepID=UPI0032668965
MKIILLRSLLLLGAFLCFGYVQAQQEITGTVSDNSGPLPGASVIEIGTTNGTQTDFDGNFTLSVAEGAQLKISYIGYLDTTLEASDSPISITLQEDAQALEEVVVVGYGSQNKKEITSAVVQLDAEEFNKGVVNSPAQLLQGKVAGLTIANRGGDPNGQSQIRLRGLSTTGANAEPLVVVDGIIGASLNNIDPNDIENINVLKDGSAAAIYGSRASSGVILVTTKKGRGDTTSFEYNGQASVSTISKSVDVMSTQEFIDAGGVNLGADNDWLDLVTQTGANYVNNFSVSGSTGSTNYRVSGNLRSTEGILRNSGFDQFNTRANINTKILDDRLSIGFNASYTNRKSEFGLTDGLRYGVLYNPTAPIYGVDSPFAFNSAQFGGYFEALGLFDSFNPVSIVEQNKNYGKRIEFLAGLNVKFAITDNLSVTGLYSKQNNTKRENQYYPTTSHYRGNATSTTKGRADFINEDFESDLFEIYGTYNPSISDKLTMGLTGGYSWQEQNEKRSTFAFADFPDASRDWSDNIFSSGAFQLGGVDRIGGGSYTRPDDRIIAFFSRVNMTWDNAIFFNASIRHEGSTRFGPDNKWGTFPAIGLGADLNKYLELKNVNLLKVRFGYGVTGALPFENGYSQEIFSFANVPPGSSETGWQTLGSGNRAPNPDLKWEEKHEINFGIEFGTDRLSAVLDIYNRDIEDFITDIAVETSVHPSGLMIGNAGRLNTKGIELTLNYDLIKNEKLTYNTGIVFSTYKSVLEENALGSATFRGNLGAPGQNDTNVVLVQEGEEIGQIIGAEWTGEVDANGSQTFVDIDGDGTIETEQTVEAYNEGDLTVLGKGIPDFELGWTNRVSIGNWDINAFFRGQFGHSLVNNYRVFFEPQVGSQTGYNFVNTELADSRIKTAKFSSHYVEKADFFRLDNLSVSYSFNLGEKTAKYIKGLSMNIAGQNLFTLTSYTGNDPEASLADIGSTDNGGRPARIDNPDPLVPGIDRRSNYFASRTFSVGLVAKF